MIKYSSVDGVKIFAVNFNPDNEACKKILAYVREKARADEKQRITEIFVRKNCYEYGPLYRITYAVLLDAGEFITADELFKENGQ